MTFISRRFADFADEIIHKEVEAGRILVSIVRKGESFVAAVNVHNFGLTSGSRERLRLILIDLRKAAANDPSNQSIVIVLGDFNYLQRGESAIRFGQTHLPSAKDVVDEAEARRWEVVLEDFTEVLQWEPTRLGKRTITVAGEERFNYTAKRLDRAFVSLEPWRLLLIKANARLYRKLFDMDKAGLSDHSPV